MRMKSGGLLEEEIEFARIADYKLKCQLVQRNLLTSFPMKQKEEPPRTNRAGSCNCISFLLINLKELKLLHEKFNPVFCSRGINDYAGM